MILFIILSIVAIAIAAIILAGTGVLGGVLLALFGDVIVFVLIVIGIVKLIKWIRKKK